jgi:GT2 family glycosyltransferase
MPSRLRWSARRKRSRPTARVVVVDGDARHSAEPVVARVRVRYPDLQLRYVSSDPGTARQRNVALDAASGDVVVYVDDDCTFARGLFEALEEAYRDPDVVGATGRISGPLRARLGSNPHSRVRRAILGGGRQGSMSPFGFRRPIVDENEARDVEFMPGPLMTARREVAARVRFDERLTGYSLVEDDDFSFRLSRCGRVRYQPAARIHHHEYRWDKRDQRKMDYLQVVNRTYLFHKNFPQTTRARAGFAALMLVFCAHRVLNREWSGLRGLLAGMAQAWRTDGKSPVTQSSAQHDGLAQPPQDRQRQTSLR